MIGQGPLLYTLLIVAEIMLNVACSLRQTVVRTVGGVTLAGAVVADKLDSLVDGGSVTHA